MMKKNIVVLGKGYIASKINQYWDNDDFNIILVSRSEFDYTTFREAEEIYTKWTPEYVVNTYGYTGVPNVDGCEDNYDECYLRNYTHSCNINQIFNNFGSCVINIGSGCIYNDESASKFYKEDDDANFGYKNNFASSYSKIKDYFQSIVLKDNPDNYILRVRMPYDGYFKEPKNYIGKLLKYPKLINYKNSITYLPDLVKVIENIVIKKPEFGIYNVVNTYPVNTQDILLKLKEFNIVNENYANIIESDFYTVDDLLTLGLAKCRRSNCQLDNTKVIDKIYDKMKFSLSSLEECVKVYKE